ncbi:MAG: hypothetical protein KAH86_05775 [Methanosarcinales archaeon]|nr:hypothetical protein [Methanosarcinales archaeon]
MVIKLLDNFEINSEIFSYIILFVIPVILLFPRHAVIAWFKGIERKKRRKLWLQSLRSNKAIEDCIDIFERVETPSGGWTALAMIIGVLGGLIVIGYIYEFLDFPVFWKSMSYSSLINIFPYILTIVLGWCMRKYIENRDDEKIVNESHLIVNLFTAINWFIFVTNIIIIAFIYTIYMNLSRLSPPDLIEVRDLFVVSFLFLIITISGLKIIRRQFLNHLQFVLNNLHSDEYSVTYITTKETEIKGKIEDIFNNDFIILKDDGLTVSVEWDSIIILKLQNEKDITMHDTSYI